MLNSIIYHIDVNSAFLSWEAVYRLALKGGMQDLREIASAVGGDMALRHGIILAKSLPAKKIRHKDRRDHPGGTAEMPESGAGAAQLQPV